MSDITDSLNKEIHLKLNQVYNMLAELKNQVKHITLCKVPTQMGIKHNETADKVPKETIDMTRKVTLRLHYTCYFPSIRKKKEVGYEFY